MFSGPFPVFSAKLNAFITANTCKWLMGPQELFDLVRALCKHIYVYMCSEYVCEYAVLPTHVNG